MDDESGSISFKGVGYAQSYYMKTVNGEFLRMKALVASNGMMAYRQKASWKCEPEDGFIYLVNNDIDLSISGEPEYLGTNASGDDE